MNAEKFLSQANIKLDEYGVPVNPEDWTKEDWADLWRGIMLIRTWIRKRHAKVKEGK
jgi:hypothetical protein